MPRPLVVQYERILHSAAGATLATKVRDIIKEAEAEADGWVLVRMHGSHRVFQHPSKPGNVIIPGNPGDEMPVGTLHSIRKQAELK